MNKINNFPLADPVFDSGVNVESQVDQFTSSEFFIDSKEGVIYSDIQVSLRSDSSPELKEKLKEYLVKNEIANNEGLSDEEILNNISSKYEDRYSAMQRLAKKTLELQKAELEAHKAELEAKKKLEESV